MFDADKRHQAAMRAPRPGLEKGLVTMIKGFQEYVRGYEATVGVKVGEDGYACDYAEYIAKALIALLSCEFGPRLDGGTLDGLIRQIATEAGLDVDML